MKQYLRATEYMDYGHPDVLRFAEKHTEGHTSEIEKAKALYLAVRDGWKYNPFIIDLRKTALQASDMFTRDYGYCTEKANLLAAAARAAGIPSRLGFAQVKNHIGTSKLESLLQTDLLVFHGYTDLYLDGQWVKATPAFNKELCEKFNVAPLAFDGAHDSIFQEYNGDGARYMEYVYDYGTFEDLPRDTYITELQEHYPHIFEHEEFEADGFYFHRGD